MPRQLLGTAIAANTITTTQLQTTVVNQISAGGGPRVSSLIYPGNDTAGNTVGGQTVYINGSGFETNNAIYINGNAVPSKSFISASNLSFTTPALSAGIYPVYVINTDNGATAIFVPGYISSAEPAWVTSAGSLSSSQDEGTAWSYTLSATGDTPITYALAAGSSLPGGISLAANGLISGTISSPTGNVTTYTFSVVATDAQNQDSTRQFTVTTATGEGVLFANNVLLIHADGTNNGNNHAFVDSSNNNFTITRNGNATQGSFSPFSQTGWSAYFDGTGDYLTVPDNVAWDYGTGDFTIECWTYQTSIGTNVILVGQYNASDGSSFEILANNKIAFWSEGSFKAYSANTVSANKWNHLAVSRSGTNLRLFLNGVLETTVTDSTDISGSTAALHIGSSASSPGAGLITGYISNVRIVKGTAVYTTAFTPPTQPLTSIANTQLLILQSNRFIDNSTNAFTITRNGDTSIQAFSPFAPTAAYSTSTVGGSGYFDGTGDGLALNYGSTTHSFWNNDFTFEYWIKTTATNMQSVAASWNDIGFGAGSYGLTVNNGIPGLSNFQSSATDQTTMITSGSTTVNDNAWHHIVVTQVAGSPKIFRLFVDGILRGYKSETTWTQSTSSANIYIGQQGPNTYNEAGRYLTGHLSGFRLSNTVVAAYSTASTTTGTSVFSVPTAPPTNTANTVALLNFTNAQIFDQTAKNVIECIGDAKVSTSVYKYGTGSIAFDGTGDYLTIPDSILLEPGSENLTWEMWINTTNSTQYSTLYSRSPASFATGMWSLMMNMASSTTGDVGLYVADYSTSGPLLQTTGVSVRDGSWHHIAVVRNGSAWTLYVDGTSRATGTWSGSVVNIAYGPYIGKDQFYGRDYNGYMDDFRITKGYARYTSNFTPPTSALKDK